MKRNMDLIRAIVLFVEEHGGMNDRSMHPVELVSRYGEDAVRYHARLVAEHGWVKGGPAGIAGLTRDGHDFVDLARSDDVWDRVRNRVDAVGSTPIDIWLDLLLRAHREAIGYTTHTLSGDAAEPEYVPGPDTVSVT